MGTSVRFLRPYLCKDLLPLRTAGCAPHAQFYSAGRVAGSTYLTDSVEKPQRAYIQERIHELRDVGADMYPSVVTDTRSVTCRDFRQQYAKLKTEESREDESVTLRGMLNRLSWRMLMADAPRKGIFI
jgi:hypothetical protein